MKRQYLSILKKLAGQFLDDQSQQAISHLSQKVSEMKEPVSPQLDLKLPVEVGPGDFAVFSDGGCRGNPGPGAWACLAQNDRGDVLYEANGLSMNTTNNKMELQGAIEGLQRLLEDCENKADIHLYSDSKYVVDGITKWVPGWKQRNWKKADRKTPENLELWQELDNLVQKNRGINFYWVKGHAGHPQNERCDQLVNMALDEAGL